MRKRVRILNYGMNENSWLEFLQCVLIRWCRKRNKTYARLIRTLIGVRLQNEDTHQNSIVRIHASQMCDTDTLTANETETLIVKTNSSSRSTNNNNNSNTTNNNHNNKVVTSSACKQKWREWRKGVQFTHSITHSHKTHICTHIYIYIRISIR